MAAAAAANAVNDCFNIGSTVLCTTCFNEEVEGEVLAFDHNTKVLILKCSSKASEELSDVFVLNLSLCSNVQVIKECNGNLLEDPQKLNLEQVKIRLRKTVQLRQTYLKSKNDDVSPEIQELYLAIAKQYGYGVCWQGSNIQILDDVTISPPYNVENVVSRTKNEILCNYIKKMVKKQFSNNTTTTTTRTTTSSETPSNPGTNTPVTTTSPTASSLSLSNAAASGSPVPAN